MQTNTITYIAEITGINATFNKSPTADTFPKEVRNAGAVAICTDIAVASAPPGFLGRKNKARLMPPPSIIMPSTPPNDNKKPASNRSSGLIASSTSAASERALSPSYFLRQHAAAEETEQTITARTEEGENPHTPAYSAINVIFTAAPAKRFTPAFLKINVSAP